MDSNAKVSTLEITTNLSTYSCQNNQLHKTWNKAVPSCQVAQDDKASSLNETITASLWIFTTMHKNKLQNYCIGCCVHHHSH